MVSRTEGECREGKRSFQTEQHLTTGLDSCLTLLSHLCLICFSKEKKNRIVALLLPPLRNKVWHESNWKRLVLWWLILTVNFTGSGINYGLCLWATLSGRFAKELMKWKPSEEHVVPTGVAKVQSNAAYRPSPLVGQVSVTIYMFTVVVYASVLSPSFSAIRLQILQTSTPFQASPKSSAPGWDH